MNNTRAYTGTIAAAGLAAFVIFNATPVLAGSYGSSAVADSNVSNQQAAQGTVWCERLDASVTESLFRQMDCGSGEVGIARPAVAGERVTNRGQSIFDRFPHNRKAPAASTDSDSDIVTTVSTTPTSGDPDGPTAGDPDEPTKGDPDTGGPDTDGPDTGGPDKNVPDTDGPTNDGPDTDNPKDVTKTF
ncbi:MAG: hypothetical protein ABJF50_10570 [Paracoccaceae bacterium]